MSTIPEILRSNAASWPRRDALVATRLGQDIAVTFSQLENQANLFADMLYSRGIQPGDPVLVFVPMSIELYVALLGIFRLGAGAVFLDPSAGLGHIDACCSRLPPRALVSVRPLRLLRPFVTGLRKIPHVFAPPRDLHGSLGNLPPPPGPDDAALITFTSGSTGQPKAAARTHRFLIAQHAALRGSIKLEEGERDLTTLPVFVLANLASGITSILPDARISRPGSVNARRIARQVARLRPARTGGSPAFYQRLLSEPACLAGFRKIYTGGAPVFPAFLKELQSATPSADVVAVYGSTEAEPICHVSCRDISAEDWEAMRSGRGLLAGLPIPEIRLRIIPDQWGNPAIDFAPQPSGCIGEIIVAGDHVLKGYLHGRGDAETKVRLDGEIWHRTGDAGYLDGNGRLWLMGRCSARISDALGTLYPFAVECLAMTFPGIRRAAFIQLGGERTLVIETRPGFRQFGDIEAACAQFRISRVCKVSMIPVDARHNAKIDYPGLERLVRKMGG
ncbi:MAG: hypothetical protein BGO12_00665 [Verrucomicrobia bacterium 61-8]|nr:AMP-binding protein [Verrucomicrobiota bacterium]OJV04289.1 MAG: hypothetical protein BGO12_00665 [Verrucomicrobia bacterium 61-8]